VVRNDRPAAGQVTALRSLGAALTELDATLQRLDGMIDRA
jgi:hypothetical protein